MNAPDLLKHMNPAPALAKRVRPVDGSSAPGKVIDVTDDGWIIWFGDDKVCHCSRADYVEAVS